MLKYNDFQKNNEMKKFSNVSKSKSNDKGKASEDNDHDNDDYNDYETKLNADILAKRKVKGDYPQTNIKNTKRNSYIKTDSIQPNDKSEYHDKKYEPSTDMGTTNMGDEDDKDKKTNKKTNEKKQVKLVGKLATFPKDTKASKAYNFLKKMEEVKIPKNKIWYLLIEKQENELQMVKYQTKKGVNLSEFVNELKKFYIENYADDKKVVSKLEKIELAGDNEGNFSAIKNIPNIKIGGVKCIRKITEDLTKLLSGKLDKRNR